MIITRTPYRVSFMGGGSDYPAWYGQNGGAVLSCSIAKYCFISARFMPPYLGTRYRVVWSHFETVDQRSEIVHPSVRGCLEYLGIDEPFEVNHAGDLPARSGLGSSSAFTVGMLNALHALRGETVSKQLLAHEAIEVEQSVLKEVVGIQDQIQTAHGGLNFVKIAPDGQYALKPILMSVERLREFESHVMLFYTGILRTASELAAEQVKATSAGHINDELQALTGMARRGAEILADGEFAEFGLLMHEAWSLKRRLTPLVTNDVVEWIYRQARNCGAYGGKLLGAGGGGFVLVFAAPDRHPQIRAALGNFLECPFRIEFDGAQVVHRS